MKIYICTHKNFNFPSGINKEIYTPIAVGTFTSESVYEKDNKGDNISYKNENYSELTLLYYLWKNKKDDIFGLVHYRRYLCKTNYFKKFGKIYIPWKRSYSILNKKDILEILMNNDIILPIKCKIDDKKNVKQHYADLHYIKDWEITKQVIKEKYPEFISSFEFIENNHYLYICNMFIGKREVINKYCEWLFNLLFEVEKRVDISSYDDYQRRIFGFLSERLFTVWLYHNKNKIRIFETKMKQF